MMLGSVTALYRYPIKSLHAEALTAAAVDAGGFVGDRAHALIVQTPGHARSGKTYRGKENRRLHLVGTFGAAETLARGAGLDVEEAVEQPHYFDAEPVSIVFDSWLRELETLAGRDVDPLRFRPNIVAASAPQFTQSEHDLVGTTLHIGDVTLDVVSPITRCVTPSYDVHTGEPDPALQRTIVTQRGNIMGIYCRVVTPGTIVPGTPIAEA
jgi:uncharacterized protein YcbX